MYVHAQHELMKCSQKNIIIGNRVDGTRQITFVVQSNRLEKTHTHKHTLKIYSNEITFTLSIFIVQNEKAHWARKIWFGFESFICHTHTHARLIELYGKSRYQSPIERKASNKSKEHKEEIIGGKFLASIEHLSWRHSHKNIVTIVKSSTEHKQYNYATIQQYQQNKMCKIEVPILPMQFSKSKCPKIEWMGKWNSSNKNLPNTQDSTENEPLHNLTLSNLL